MLSDAHAHLNDKAFFEDLDEVAKKCIDEGVRLIVNSSWDRASSERAFELAQKYENMFFTVGVHPHNAKDTEPHDFDVLKSLAKEEKCVAWGEIGLDYHYDLSPREMQKEFFGEQLKIADEFQMPVVCHLREAYADANEIIEKNKDKIRNGFLLHCYSGSMELARDFYNKFDFYYSFGGAITFKNNNKKAVMEVIPRTRILLETDCPYMTPVPKRGQRNDPSNLNLVRDEAAKNLGISKEEVEELTYQNALRFYRIKRG